VTEAEWLTSTDPHAVLAFLRESGRASDRKLRLFGVACSRRVWHLMADARSRRAVEVAERFADGWCGEADLRDAGRAARKVWQADEESPSEAACYATWAEERPVVAGDLGPETVEVWSAAEAAAGDGSVIAARALAEAEADAREAAGVPWGRAFESAWSAEREGQVALLRDLFGNPFRPPPVIAPAWLARNDNLVPRLAGAAYEERQLPSGHLDPARLAALADALEDAGCTDAGLLQHLRGDGPHARGCFTVDAVLGRS
jgi:hypothetical protein